MGASEILTVLLTDPDLMKDLREQRAGTQPRSAGDAVTRAPDSNRYADIIFS